LRNVRFLNYVDFEILPFVLSSADVLIAILVKDAGTYCVPSKVLTYHCIGRPLLLSVPKENLVARIVKNNTSGLVAESGDVDAFIRLADTFKKDSELRIRLGKNAKEYAQNNFDINTICNSFISCFN
jgi:colanic acid biosynthesis glycosyl transferase WcaI